MISVCIIKHYIYNFDIYNFDIININIYINININDK